MGDAAWRYSTRADAWFLDVAGGGGVLAVVAQRDDGRVEADAFRGGWDGTSLVERGLHGQWAGDSLAGGKAWALKFLGWE